MKSTARYRAKVATVSSAARVHPRVRTPPASAAQPTAALLSRSIQYVAGDALNHSIGIARIASSMARLGGASLRAERDIGGYSWSPFWRPGRTMTL